MKRNVMIAVVAVIYALTGTFHVNSEVNAVYDAVSSTNAEDSNEYELVLSCSEKHFYDDEDTLTYFYVDTDYEGDFITLIDADSQTEYIMVDDGLFSSSGDDLPYDGVYTARFELDTTMTSFSKEYHFYAVTEDGSVSNTVAVKITKRITDTQINEMAAVDTAISNLTSAEDYRAASYDEKISKMYDLLVSIAEAGTEQYPYSLLQMDSIHLSDDKKMYTYQYYFGMPSSVMIVDPAFQTETATTTTETTASTTSQATTTETTSITSTTETSSATEVTTVSTTESTPEATEPIFRLGDCNDDGDFGVSDVVLLQKWLLAVPDTHLANWKAADFCDDERLDVFDLCLMKRALIQGQQTSTIEMKASNHLTISDSNGDEVTTDTEDTAISQKRKNDYIAVFHGEKDSIVYETYIYKVNNGADNYGFDYVNVKYGSLSEQGVVIGNGTVMWTDEVFTAAEKNNAYNYVMLPDDEKNYTIEEFMARFLMN